MKDLHQNKPLLSPTDKRSLRIVSLTHQIAHLRREERRFKELICCQARNNDTGSVIQIELENNTRMLAALNALLREAESEP